jgi:hypothetical protein
MFAIWIVRIKNIIVNIINFKFVDALKTILIFVFDITIFLISLSLVGRTVFGLQVSALLNVSTSFIISKILF